MNIQRFASFSAGEQGGNPAGVVITDQMLNEADMQRIAAEVGYSETAFAAPQKDGYRVRYFAPESEVPFCGHATIALGAALAQSAGDGRYTLYLNQADITVEGRKTDALHNAALQSPATKSEPLPEDQLDQVLDLFRYSKQSLDNSIPPARIHGGADHVVLTLKSREDLARMDYDLKVGAELMRALGLVTIMLVHRIDDHHYDVRNAFASGGVLEDPATGAAAAAFSGYLRDLEIVPEGRITLRQGEDMGSPSNITTDISPEKGTSIRVSGTVRPIL